MDTPDSVTANMTVERCDSDLIHYTVDNGNTCTSTARNEHDSGGVKETSDEFVVQTDANYTSEGTCDNMRSDADTKVNHSEDVNIDGNHAKNQSKDDTVADGIITNGEILLDNINADDNLLPDVRVPNTAAMETGEEPDVEIEQGEKAGPDEGMDGGWGWMIVLGAALVHLLMGGFERSNGVMYLQMRERFDRSATETAWVLSIFSTLRLAIGPLASAMVNRFSCRTVVMVGSTICTLGVFISAFVPDMSYLYVTYSILGGVGRSLTYTPSLIIVGTYFNKKRGIAVGLATAGVGLGTFLFPPCIEMMFDLYGWRGTFLILTGVIANFYICGALFRPLDLHRRFVKQDRILKTRQEAIANGEAEEDLLRPVSMATHHQNRLASQSAAKMSSSIEITANVKIEARRASLWKRKLDQVKLAVKGSDSKKNSKPFLDCSLLRNFGFLAICVQILLYTISFNSTFVFLPALAKEKGVPILEGAYLVSILGIFDMIARIGMSSILDVKKIKPYRLLVYNAVMFVNAAIAMLLPSMRQFWQFVIVCACYGLLSGTYISQKSVILVDVLGVENLTSSFGILLLFQGVGSLLGPTIGGLFKDFLGSYDMAFYFGSLGIVVGGLTMAVGNVWLYKQKRKKLADAGTA